MKKSSGFYSSLGLLILLNAIVKPLWVFGIDRQVQNVVGLESYGVYFSLLNLSIVLSFLADWGFTAFFNRQLAAHEENFINYAGNFLLLKLLFSFFYLIAVFIAAWFSGVSRWDILLYAVLIQILTSLFVFFRAIITSQQWFRAEAWLSVTDKTLMILICGVFLYFPSLFGSMTIDRFLLFQTACLVVAIIISFLFLFKKRIQFSVSRNWVPEKKILLQLLPFGIIVLAMSLHARLDAFLLERININGAHEAGIYAAAYRLLDVANIACYMVASFMLPYIARQWSKKEEINNTILNCRHLLLMFSVGTTCTAVFLAPWVQRILYHHDDETSVAVLQWCLPALIGYSFTHIYGTVLTATGRAVQFCYIVLISVAINILLNLILIPLSGAMGCCIAALCSQFFCGIASMLYVKQKMMLSLNFRSLLIYTFTGLLLSGFFMLFSNWPVAKWLLIIVAGMLTVAIMLITRLTGITAWVATIRTRQYN